MEVAFYMDLVNLAVGYVIDVNATADILPTYGCFNQTLVENEGNRTIMLTEKMAEGIESEYGLYTPDETKRNWYFQVKNNFLVAGVLNNLW